MNTNKTPAQGQRTEHLAIQINALEALLSKVTECFNAHSLTKVSFFITGKNKIRRNFNEMLHTGTNTGLPVPADLLHQFFQQYGDNLIAERAVLIKELERLENPVLQLQDPPAPRILDKAEFHCPPCARITGHHLFYYGSIVHWQCNECDNVNQNAEVN